MEVIQSPWVREIYLVGKEDQDHFYCITTTLCPIAKLWTIFHLVFSLPTQNINILKVYMFIIQRPLNIEKYGGKSGV